MSSPLPNLRPQAVIFGCSGLTLTAEEKRFFQKHQPLGFILFSRNIETPDQVKTLVHDLKATVDHTMPPILIDQEGGRVARLKPPYWKAYPPARVFGERAEKDLEESKTQAYQNFKAIAEDLKALGITVNCAPLLDIAVKGAHDIIGDRAFSKDPEVAAILGKEVIRAFNDVDIIPIIKHIPTHGPVDCDSHHELPVVTLTHEELKPHFKVFQENVHAPWAMTAHIIYTAFDKEHPATHSAKVIRDIIRQEIGFQGFLVSDDVGMKALQGSYADRARKALAAGCDAVLHCSGKMSEMEDVMMGISPLSENADLRWRKTHGHA